MQSITDLIDVTGAADALALALSLLAGATLGGATLGAVSAQAETAPFGAATFAGVAAGAILGAVAGACAYRRGAHRIESPRRVRVEDRDWQPGGHDTDPLARWHTTVVGSHAILSAPGLDRPGVAPLLGLRRRGSRAALFHLPDRPVVSRTPDQRL